MNSQKIEVEEGEEILDDIEVNDASGHALTNGNVESPECLSRVHSGDSLEDKSDTCDSSESALNEKTENVSSSQAFGGARPKTTRTNDKNKVRNGDRTTRNSESCGVEIKVKTCDTEFLLGSGPRTTVDKKPGLPYNDISNIPKLESRPTPSEKSKRPSIPDISREEVVDNDLTEDDCYIYTYKGGTAYLSADLPNSFFR